DYGGHGVFAAPQRSLWARGPYTRVGLPTAEEPLLHRLVADPALLQILGLGGFHFAKKRGMVGQNEVLEQLLVEIDESGGGLPVPGHDHVPLPKAVQNIGGVDLEISQRHEFHTFSARSGILEGILESGELFGRKAISSRRRRQA